MSEVKLYQGDCLEILPTLEAGSVDAVITDPRMGLIIQVAGNQAGKARLFTVT
jgi:DNA modification methylase